MMLSDAGFDNYRLLTRNKTFYVVDTEYTRPDTYDPVRSSRLISIAIVPVVNGVKQTPFYVEMNPGVPVSHATTSKTGFTTESVARKRPFAFYAQRILNVFTDPTAVFVSHTSADIRVLAGELERLDAVGLTPGLVNLPYMPLLDTALLPRLLAVPGLPSNTGTISLVNLCGVLRVPFNDSKAHHARYDAGVTADVLLELLKHAAGSGRVDFEELLAEHNRGTTQTPATGGVYSSAGDTHPSLPHDHLAKHGTVVLLPDADEDSLAEFTELVTECVALRCQYLTDEMLTATDHAGVLFPHLWALLGTCTEPGQAGTLLGALAVLLPDVVPSTRMVRWWATHKPDVTAAVRCGQARSDACPACRASESCPVDVFYTGVARTAALCGQATLTKQTVKYKLFSTPGKKDRRVAQWSVHHPELAGYMAAMVVEYERDNGGAVLAAKYLKDAGTFGLQAVEPRFGLLYADYLQGVGKPGVARALVEDLLTRQTTDEAFDALRMWLDRLDQYQAAATRRANDIIPTRRPRMVRPRDRVNRNPYLVYG